MLPPTIYISTEVPKPLVQGDLIHVACACVWEPWHPRISGTTKPEKGGGEESICGLTNITIDLFKGGTQFQSGAPLVAFQAMLWCSNCNSCFLLHFSTWLLFLYLLRNSLILFHIIIHDKSPSLPPSLSSHILCYWHWTFPRPGSKLCRLLFLGWIPH